MGKENQGQRDSKSSDTQSQKNAAFMAHLQEASELVHSWPAWKQEALGRQVVQPTATHGNASSSKR